LLSGQRNFLGTDKGGKGGLLCCHFDHLAAGIKGGERGEGRHSGSPKNVMLTSSVARAGEEGERKRRNFLTDLLPRHGKAISYEGIVVIDQEKREGLK